MGNLINGTLPLTSVQMIHLDSLLLTCIKKGIKMSEMTEPIEKMQSQHYPKQTISNLSQFVAKNMKMFH